MIFDHHHAHIVIGDCSSKTQDRVKDAVLLGKYKDESKVVVVSEHYHFLGVDDARKIRLFLNQSEPNNKHIIFFLCVESFSQDSQNALLKVFEEPKDGVTIVMLTPYEHVLLATLRSRVLIHYMGPSEILSPIDVALFFKASLPTKLSLVDAFVKKIAPEEEDHEEGRAHAKLFLHAYESYLYQKKDITNLKQYFDALFFAKQFMHSSSFSVKQLLHHVALVPEYRVVS